MSALVVAGLVASGSAAQNSASSTPPKAPQALLAASSGTSGANARPDGAPLTQTLGMLPAETTAPRTLRAVRPAPADGVAPTVGSVPLQSISLPSGSGALGIPEIVLAAYRNAELALQTSEPGCGLTWNLLAGIGRIESGHASNGRTDAAGTTNPPIFGPALDGTLAGNEIIRDTSGGYVRALGPMQFLPSTWSRYAADGNADGHSDPHNVFDAALGAGKYLCSGGLNLRDPQQELRAVLRYNNSMSYAANVLSWSAAYRTGGTPAAVTISPDLVPPGSAPTTLPANGPDLLAVDTQTATDAELAPPPPPTATMPTPRSEPMIIIPGLPPIPCGILCPPAPGSPRVADPLPAPLPGAPVDPNAPAPQATPADPNQPPPPPPPPAEAAPADPPAPAPAPEPTPAPPPPPNPSITLPGGLVVQIPAGLLPPPPPAQAPPQ